MDNRVITIDGPAGSGKSTVARQVARKQGIAFLDTGAMYRAVTLAAIRDNTDITDQTELLRVLDRHEFEFLLDENKQMKVRIDQEDVTGAIRSTQVTENARFIASCDTIRKRLVQMQRDFAAAYPAIVTEGRDQGTVAFADADIKFYLTADLDERARRRQKDLQDAGVHQPLESIRRDIHRRDQSDQARRMGPLKQAADAIQLDTSDLTIEQVVTEIEQVIKKRWPNK